MAPLTTDTGTPGPPPEKRRAETSARSADTQRAASCWLLREDSELAEAVSPSIRDQAAEDCIAPTLRVARGRCEVELVSHRNDGIGLIVLEGLLLRRVALTGRHGAELLGAGDVLRPWAGRDPAATLRPGMSWQALEPTRLAVLDEHVSHELACYPGTTEHLVGRTLERSHRLAVIVAILAQPRAELRLHMFFWNLAERWGRVRSDGVIVPLHLTHNILADLVATDRRTIASSLAELHRKQLLSPVGNSWLLRGKSPSGPVKRPTSAATR